MRVKPGYEKQNNSSAWPVILLLFGGLYVWGKNTPVPVPPPKEKGTIEKTFDWTTKWGGKAVKLYTAVSPVF